jgi:hypothetical protein
LSSFETTLKIVIYLPDSLEQLTAFANLFYTKDIQSISQACSGSVFWTFFYFRRAQRDSAEKTSKFGLKEQVALIVV